MRVPEMRYCGLGEFEKHEDQKIFADELVIDALYLLWLRIGPAGKQTAVVHPAAVMGMEPELGSIRTIHLGLITPDANLMAQLRPDMDMQDGNLRHFGLTLPAHIAAPRRVPSGFLVELVTDL